MHAACRQAATRGRGTLLVSTLNSNSLRVVQCAGAARSRREGMPCSVASAHNTVHALLEGLGSTNHGPLHPEVTQLPLFQPLPDLPRCRRRRFGATPL